MSKDYLDKWEERQKQNTEIIEQQQTKTKMSDKSKHIWVIVEKKGFIYHEIKRYKNKQNAVMYLAKLWRIKESTKLIKLKTY